MTRDIGLRAPCGIQSGLTVDSTAAGIALTVPTGKVPQGATISVYGAPIRYWVNGTAPTATTGHRKDVYGVIELMSAEEVTNFKAIRESGVSATLEVTFYL